MTIAQRLEEVREQLASSAGQSGREPSEVELLVVSKTFPAEVVQEVVAAGQRSLGENRVQEALEKQPLLSPDIAWHLIGPLQRNKVRKVVGKFDCLQGVDSLKLAQAIARVAQEEGCKQSVLLQVKIGGEETKSGFEAEELRQVIEELSGLDSLQIDGLMTIPPPVSHAEEARPYFAAARELRDELVTKCGLPLTQLSMGMSGDFQAAIAEGSTMVRVGSAIFGKRG
jgi:pyridoxal phosphate enzyme (YggS family)